MARVWSLTTTAVAALVLGASALQRPAAAGGVDARTSETPHLKVTASTGPASDRTLTLFLDVALKPRMHVYAPRQAGYIGVTLTLPPQSGVTPAPPRFPSPERVFFERIDETQLVYSRPFRILQDVTLTRDAPRTIKGLLRYQACDNQVCFLPRTIPVEWRITAKKV